MKRLPDGPPAKPRSAGHLRGRNRPRALGPGPTHTSDHTPLGPQDRPRPLGSQGHMLSVARSSRVLSTIQRCSPEKLAKSRQNWENLLRWSHCWASCMEAEGSRCCGQRGQALSGCSVCMGQAASAQPQTLTSLPTGRASTGWVGELLLKGRREVVSGQEAPSRLRMLPAGPPFTSLCSGAHWK